MELRENVELSSFTTLGLGGPARFWVEALEPRVLFEALTWANARGIPVRVLGGGSNLLVADSGFDGLVVRVGWRGVEWRDALDGSIDVEVGAGEVWDDLVALTVSRNWAGLECLSGIPGQVGATPIQNVGAYGHEAGEHILSVKIADRRTLEVLDWTAESCQFGYRSSVFKEAERDRFVVLSVRFRLVRGGPAAIRYPELARELGDGGHSPPDLERVRDTVLNLRRAKSMLHLPGEENARSCGSFFVNPRVSPETRDRLREQLGNSLFPEYPEPDGRIKLSAAWLIERAGFRRGVRKGAVGLSTRHALALVCHEGATANELWAWALHIRTEVGQQLGVWLEPEPDLWPSRKAWPS